jgi:hypothetical protein
MDAKATIHYANNALHAFGAVTFQTDAPEFIDLSYGSFVAEIVSDFNTGKSGIDIFQLSSAGMRDGSPVPALLPPGQAPPAASSGITSTTTAATSASSTGRPTGRPCRRGQC